ncbi:MAG: hypothetical protein R6U25_11880 [Alkalispirochaeta sp.]
MIVSAVRSLCFALVSLIAVAGVTGQESMSPEELRWDEIGVAPGTYADSIVLSPRGTPELEYRFLDSAGHPHTAYFLPLTDGIELHAPDSAEVRYHLAIRRVGESSTTRVGEFVLDTLAPDAPRFRPSPGLHTAPIRVMPREGSSGHEVALRILDEAGSRFAPIPPRGLRLAGAPGTVQDYRIAAYAVDQSGNRSSVATYQYRIDRSREATPRTDPLLSPRPGTYANEQALVLDDTGLTDISVRLTHSGAESQEIEYMGTPVIPGEGDFQLTVQATVPATGEPYRRSVSWSQEVADSIPPQGRSTSTVRLSPPARRSRYTFEDRAVTDRDPRWLRAAELTPPPEGTRTVVVRYRADTADRDIRLVYLLDGRRAPTPEIAGGEDSGVVTVYSLGDTEVQWAETSENGAARFSESAQGTTRIDLSTVKADSILVRARFPGGRWTQRTMSLSELRAPPERSSGQITDDGVTVSLTAPDGEETTTVTNRATGSDVLRFRDTAPVRWRPPLGFTAQLRLGDDPGVPEVTIDRTPLAPPELTVEGDRVTLSGSGQIFYRLDGSPDAVYEGPVELSGVPEARRRYRVDAYRIFDSQISPTITAYPVIDRRTPRVPPPHVASGRELTPGTFISRDEVTRVRFPSPYDDLELHYEATSDGQALLPQASSPQVGEGIALTTPAGSEQRWAIRVRGRFPGRDRWSPVYQMEVTVDRRPPQAPVLSTDPESSGVVAFEQPSHEDTSIWYRLRPSDPYRRYTSPVTIDRTRIENSLTISAYARDRAGNQTALQETPTVAPLSQGPEPPQLTVNGRLPEDPHIIRSREAVLEARVPEGVRWRIREVNSTTEDNQFVPYSEPEVLSRGTYRINAYRERGSERSRVIELVVTIDPERPRTPAAPYISYAPDGRSGTVYWPGAQAEQIFVSVITDPEADPDVQPFSVSDGVLPWAIPEGASRVSLAYFSVGESGRRSETEVLQLEAARSQPPAELSGVGDGQRYPTGRIVEFSGNGEVRFTVTSDGSSPGAVRVSSPRYEEPLVFSASVGETTHYHLRYRTFQGETPVSEERSVSFVIDREPPSLPQLTGAAAGGYYSSSRVVRLLPDDRDDTIMYRLRTDTDTAGTDPTNTDAGEAITTDFVRYSREDLRLPEDPGEPRVYRIEAYAIDRAGNRSTGIAAWDVTIDATSLHVSATTGDDESGDGSRQSPLASLDEALARISAGSRNTIFIATGEYSLSPDIFATATAALGRRRLNLLGGYTPERWIAHTSGTSITVRERDTLTLSTAVRLEGVALSQPLHFTPAHPSHHLELRHVALQTDHLPALVLEGGTAALFDSSVTRTVEVTSGAALEAQGSSLGELSMDGGTASIRDTIMAGARIAAGARLTVASSRITPRRPVDISGLLYAEESTLELRSSVVQAAADDPILIRGRNADITVEGSLIYGAGQRSAIAIRARGGRVSISDSLIDIDSQGYGYGVFLRDAPVEIAASAIITRVAADGIAVAGGDSPVSVDDSLLWVAAVAMGDSGGVAATGVTVDGTGVDDLVVRRSHLLASGRGAELGAAIRLGSDGAARIRENQFGGWGFILVQGTAADTWGRSGRLQSVDELNRSRFGNGNSSVEYKPEAAPPRRESPQITIPRTAVPEALTRILRAGRGTTSENQENGDVVE